MTKYEALKKRIEIKIERNAKQMERKKDFEDKTIYNQCVEIDKELKDLLDYTKHLDIMEEA